MDVWQHRMQAKDVLDNWLDIYADQKCKYTDSYNKC